MKRIAFSGKIVAGKTTAANALVRDLGFQKMAIADELKSVSRDIGDWIRVQPRLLGKNVGDLDDHGCLAALAAEMNNKQYPLGRAWLQWLGQRMREVHQHVWAKALIHRLPNANIVVDDVRFKNEALILSEYGFTLARIDIPPEIQEFRIKVLYPEYDSLSLLNDPSETDLDNWQWQKVFDGSLPKEEFEYQIVQWVSSC